VLLIVTNPVDVLTRLAIRYSKFPPSRVIGSGTTLDSARLRYLLGQHYDLHPSSIHAYILGEHGDSSFPVWSSASIAGVDIRAYPGFDQAALSEIYQKVHRAAYEIISRKGATYYAIGIMVSQLCYSILRDERRIFPVSVLVKDYYGVNGVCLSVPCVLGRAGVVKQVKIRLDASEKKLLTKSASILNAAVSSAK